MMREEYYNEEECRYFIRFSDGSQAHICPSARLNNSSNGNSATRDDSRSHSTFISMEKHDGLLGKGSRFTITGIQSVCVCVMYN